jgi:hydroxymethylpyrimidine/phosphomethylpyrimidine kinase
MLLEICTFDRAAEPPGVKTMDWGVASCCRQGVPDVIYDLGAVGKEAMIRILGENPDGVVKNILKLSARMNKE